MTKSGKPFFPPSNGQKSQILSVANEDPRIDPAAFKVLEFLLQHHNDQVGLVCPSHPTIAKCIGFSARWVGEKVRLLARNGYVKRTRMSGPKSVHRYTFPLDPIRRFKLPRGSRFTNVESTSNGEVRQEPQRPNQRNSSAGKYNNKYIKDAKKRTNVKKLITSCSKARSAKEPKRASERRTQELQIMMVDALGGPETGWETLMSIDEGLVADLCEQLDSGQVKLAEAIERIMNEPR